jgi:hypothetical protein
MRSRMPVVVGALAAVGWAGVAAAQTAVVVEPLAPAFERFSLIYSPEIALQDTSFGSALNRAGRGDGIQNIGFEISSLTGWYTRYHVQIDFTHGYGANGVRLEPLAFGWALPLVRAPGFGLEIEPLLSLADGILLVTDDDNHGQNVTFLLGSGAEVQLNMTVGPFYAFLSPIGLEVRWLQITSGDRGSAYGGADPLWRLRIGVGVQY